VSIAQTRQRKRGAVLLGWVSLTLGKRNYNFYGDPFLITQIEKVRAGVHTKMYAAAMARWYCRFQRRRNAGKQQQLWRQTTTQVRQLLSDLKDRPNDSEWDLSFQAEVA
jgi:hypothetical protein